MIRARRDSETDVNMTMDELMASSGRQGAGGIQKRSHSLMVDGDDCLCDPGVRIQTPPHEKQEAPHRHRVRERSRSPAEAAMSRKKRIKHQGTTNTLSGVMKKKLENALLEHCSTAFHLVGSLVMVSILITLATGWPRNYINFRLSINFMYLVQILVMLAKHPWQLAPKSLIAWLRHDRKWLASGLVLILLLFVGLLSASWSVAFVIPHEIVTNFSAKTSTVLGLLGLCLSISMKMFRNIYPTSLLKSLRMVAIGVFVWTLVMWGDETINCTGRIRAIMSPPDPKLSICSVYVASFISSPRLTEIVPRIREQVKGLEGAEWFVYNGTRMPRKIQPYRSDLIIKELIDKEYLSKDSFQDTPCGSGRTCLRPNTLFDQRLPNLGAAMGHIHIWERFLKDHVDKKSCVALVLEDDANLNEGFSETLAKELPTIPSNWDFISLEGAEKVCNWGVWQNEGLNLWHHMKMNQQYRYNPPFSWSGVYSGGYLVTTNGAMRLLDNLPLTSNIDTWINMLAFFGKINMYIRCPHLVYQGTESLTAEGGKKYEQSYWDVIFGTSSWVTPTTRPVAQEAAVNLMAVADKTSI
mmetsp:Transcript_6026/g.14555  ORF Transcript_6026/g.14555 Transcript_6026/m.14555 type:complete len:581 (-) Transcript_6026:83-1825(-)